jgi:hypothetical protein
MPKWTWENTREVQHLRYGPVCAGVFTVAFWILWEINSRIRSVLEKPLVALGQNPILAYFMCMPFIALQGILCFKLRDLYLKDATGWIVILDPLIWTAVFTACVMLFNRYRLFLRI